MQSVAAGSRGAPAERHAIRSPNMEHDDIATTAEATAATEAPADLIEELLVEEISIDGMCGVY